ncbi:hypothetical protein [Murid betaherpesvirus 1]|uniref:Chemokine interleukin-8-like domain-containing protein n=3 Tax=Murid herpesvirus 1 TaxID=10366 RepID=D3XDV5_MUHVS|nr:hypothetical protein QKG64_gp121 [Murid betaherpesvirus 1]YP_214132.1 hypothetical protein MuHV1_gp123 [Murid betaherpesvirus 1]CAP08168.1 m131 protein [Murine cytomegalovirus (strain K181)]AAA58340.1 ORF HJ1 [Murid betaherpesvirus 1]ADD10499.1 hypothetical protein [Murid betaherpesvirus 1]AQQ81389.1 m131 protein [Murid betaherpesvirus 1]CAJ1013344.1 m131 protein [Murid betaherpesvirus 1]
MKVSLLPMGSWRPHGLCIFMFLLNVSLIHNKISSEMGTLLVCCLVCCVVLVVSTVADLREPCCARPQLHPLPLYAVQSAEYTNTSCGREVVFTTFSGMRVCAKRAWWSDRLLCLVR